MALGRLGTNALVNIAHSNTLIFRGLLNKVKGGKFAELNARKGKRMNVRKTDRLENSTNIQFRKPCWGASKVDLSADLWVLLWSSPTWLLYGFVCLFGRLVVGFLYSIGCYQLNLQYMSGKVIFFSIYKNKNIIRQRKFFSVAPSLIFRAPKAKVAWILRTKSSCSYSEPQIGCTQVQSTHI